MLTIKNVTKLGNRKVFANWVIRNINCHPVQEKYMFDVQCMSPIGVCMDRCTISLNRKGILIHSIGQPSHISYFFNYNGEQTNVCGGAEWLGDMKNFVGQMEYIIKKYHNKQ
jgi:hypothetical protein